MKKYIECAKQTPFFGMTFFDVKDKMGTDVTIGIAEDGLFLFKSTNLVSFI